MTSTRHEPTSTPPHPEPPGPVGDDMTTSQWARVGVLAALLVLLTVTTGIWGLVVVLGIVVMVFLHELGHYMAAKRAGMLVTEFFIGFGPRIWSFRRGDTEYGLKVIPAGAYVRIVGMNSLEEVDPADEARTYRQAGLKDRLCTVLAGVGMNFAVATLLIWVLLAVVGLPGGAITDARADQSRWSIVDVQPGTGAAAAGLEPGDRITAIEGRAIDDMDQLKPTVADYPDQTVTVTYVRDGQVRTTEVEIKALLDDEGRVVPRLGITTEMETFRVNPLTAVPLAFVDMADFTFQSAKGLVSFFSPSGITDFADQVANADEDRAAREEAQEQEPAPTTPGTSTPATEAEPPGENRLISIVGFFNVGTQAASSGIAALLMLFVLLNIGLGVFNLVPLLPFDGGHAVIAVYERIQERRKHMTTRYFTDVNKLLPLTYVVVFVLVGIFVTTTYLDLANPITVEK